MLSYRHSFHAGNFADVLKHVVLMNLVTALQKKESPVMIYDTHAGAGMYDLHSAYANKNKEYQTGVSLIWQQNNIPQPIKPYIAALQTINGVKSNKTSVHFYPGSPWLCRFLLRPCDRLVLSEFHPTDYQLLKDYFHQDEQVAIHQMDGYQGLKAFLPPRERRGLVLIDPAYELKDELDRLIAGVHSAYHRWPTGVYAIWLPLTQKVNLTYFYSRLVNLNIRKILQIELSIFPNDVSLGLAGSVMLIINPPWQFNLEMGQVLPWLWKKLSPKGLGSQSVDWLVPE